MSWIQTIFDILIVFLKEIFKKVDFEINQQTKTSKSMKNFREANSLNPRGGGGGVLGGNFGTGVRVSFLKPTPIICLVFAKNDLFIYFFFFFFSLYT